MTTPDLPIDRRIVEELGRDARNPIATLSRRVNLSRNAVRQRIEKLERTGIIVGYTIRTGRAAAERRPAKALMFIFRKECLPGDYVTAALGRIPEVRACHVISGEFDLVVNIEAASQDRIQEIWAEIVQIPGVINTQTAFVLRTIFEQ